MSTPSAPIRQRALTRVPLFFRDVMEKLGAEELAQERLERMFTFYNAHWPEYYGTDNVFTIE